MECPTKTLTFKVSRKNPELIAPSGPTPHKFKPLSDIDVQGGLRMLPIYVAVYEGSPAMEGKDPVDVIRQAIAKALVFYYPYAGRLREIAATGKLVVECTAEGLLFIEAEADATVLDFSGSLHPPFPNVDELLYNVPGSDGITDCPLLLFQVTRLKCGGFIIGVRFNHQMGDAVGTFQFYSAVSEIACGREVPSVHPVWERELLTSRNPPIVLCEHPEYDIVPTSEGASCFQNTVESSFFFSHNDIATLCRILPKHHQNCSQFDLVTACVWRCRTLALATNPNPNPNEKYRLLCVLNVRNILNPPLPLGYYGNAIVASYVDVTPDEIYKKPFHYIIELVRKAKEKVTDEYVRSAMDLLVIRGRPSFVIDRTFLVSDLGRLPMDKVDFGWGKAVYAGVGKASPDSIPGVICWLMPFANNEGENGILVPICIPSDAMWVFRKELKVMMDDARTRSISNTSAL